MYLFYIPLEWWTCTLCLLFILDVGTLSQSFYIMTHILCRKKLSLERQKDTLHRFLTRGSRIPKGSTELTEKSYVTSFGFTSSSFWHFRDHFRTWVVRIAEKVENHWYRRFPIIILRLFWLVPPFHPLVCQLSQFGSLQFNHKINDNLGPIKQKP